MKTLRNKVIIITGAGGSIAGAIEEAFRKEGAQLVLVDREGFRVQGRASSFGGLGIESDMRTRSSAKDVVSQVTARFGRVDGLIHLVGDVVTGDVATLEESAFDQAFDTNVRTLFNATQAVLPELLKQPEAFIASIGSFEAWEGGAAGRSLFAAAKSAVVSYLRSLDHELQHTAVEVSVVVPMAAVDTHSNRARPKREGEQFVHPNALAQAFVVAASCSSGGTFFEIPVYPPRSVANRAA